MISVQVGMFVAITKLYSFIPVYDLDLHSLSQEHKKAKTCVFVLLFKANADSCKIFLLQFDEYGTLEHVHLCLAHTHTHTHTHMRTCARTRAHTHTHTHTHIHTHTHMRRFMIEILLSFIYSLFIPVVNGINLAGNQRRLCKINV